MIHLYFKEKVHLDESSKLQYSVGKCHIIVPDNHSLSLAKSILTSLPATTAFCINGVSAL